jgi:hypothetical protein
MIREDLADSVSHFLGGAAVMSSAQPLHWDPTSPGKCLVPDLALRFDLAVRFGRTSGRGAWKIWELGGPELAVEIADGVAGTAPNVHEQLAAYRHTGVRELVHFDPGASSVRLRIWDRLDRHLVARDSADPEFRRCEALSLYWCVLEVPGRGPALRLARDRNGRDLVLTPAESKRKQSAPSSSSQQDPSSSQRDLSSSQRCFT